MRTPGKLPKIFPTRLITLMLFCFAVLLYGCGNNSDKSKPSAVSNQGRVDFDVIDKETDRTLSKDVKKGNPGETHQEAGVTKSASPPHNKADLESAMTGLELDFYFPSETEENEYLKVLERNVCDAETIAHRRKESEGLVSCLSWKAKLKNAGTLLEMKISRYEDSSKASEAINRIRSTGGFIAGNDILVGDEQWPQTQKGQIEARSFIKSYYGRIRPIYVYRNEKKKPEDYLQDNDRELERLIKEGK